MTIGADQQRTIVARIHVGEPAAVRDRRPKEGRVPVSGNVEMKVAVDSGRGLSQRPLLPIRAHRGAQFDHEHGRAHALASHVPQRQVQQASVIGEVVIIAAHGFARLGSACQIVTRYLGRRTRQQACLDLRGHA